MILGRNSRLPGLVCVLATWCSLEAGAAAAQQVQIPPTLEPSRVPQNLERSPAPAAPPPISLPRSEDNVAPVGAESVSFVFQGLMLEGATALPGDQLRAAWPYAPGETATVAAIFEFANAVTAAYRRAGYALSFAVVPEQTLDGGVFTIRVIEGFVERIAIEGVEDGAARARIQDIADRILESRPLRSVDLERYLLLINDLPGVTVAGVLSPAEAEGGAVLTLQADHDPVSGSLGYNAFVPKALGRHIVEGSVEFTALTSGSDLLRLWTQRSLTSDGYQSIWGEFSTGVGANGTRLGLSAMYAKTDPEDPLLDILEYSGESVYARLYAEHAVIRSRSRNLYVGAELALNNAGSDILGARFFDDRLRTFSLWSSYQFADALQGSNSVKGTFTQGLDILDERGDSRADGVADYTIVEIDAERTQPLGRFFGGFSSARLTAAGQGTISSGGLFSAAECSYGGRRFGRGFDSGVLTGEHCLQGALELHWVRDADLPGLGTPSVFDVYAFVDAGVAWQKGEMQPGETSRSSASSFGIGLNLGLTPQLTGLIEASDQLDAPSAADADARLTAALIFQF
jgi:hemolysin activation/secretion protein